MYLNRFLTAAAAVALVAGAAHAQTAGSSTPATKPAGAAAGAHAGHGTAMAAEQTMAAPSSTATAATPTAGAVRASGDIVSTAQAAGQFTTFLKAAEATGLTPVLKSTQGLTVFAPTDAAFAALPPGELDRLMQPANRQQLQDLLKYHVVNASVDSAKLKGAKGPVPTVAGTSITADGTGASVMVNDATVTQADVRATNGIIHVVDKVLMPSTATASATSAGANASATAPSNSTDMTEDAAPAGATSTGAAASGDKATGTNATPASKPGQMEPRADSTAKPRADASDAMSNEALSAGDATADVAAVEPQTTSPTSSTGAQDPSSSGSGSTVGSSTSEAGKMGDSSSAQADQTTTTPGAPVNPPAGGMTGETPTGQSTTTDAGMSTPPAAPAPAAPMASTDASARASSMSPEQQAALKAGDPNVTSNPPVPDTTENRAKYGRPQSNAGKKSAASGN